MQTVEQRQSLHLAAYLHFTNDPSIPSFAHHDDHFEFRFDVLLPPAVNRPTRIMFLHFYVEMAQLRQACHLFCPSLLCGVGISLAV